MPIDMVLYLLLLQLLPGIALTRTQFDDPTGAPYLVLAQSSLIILFLFVWGGYSKDSWDYLIGFDSNPFTFDDEWLFWIVGHVLHRFLYDPWPLKVLCVLAGAIMCFAITSYFSARDWGYCAAGLFALLLVPAFYLLIGGAAIRQGIGGALVVLAIVNLHLNRTWTFVILSALALFVHQFSILLAIAGVLSKLNNIPVRYALAFAPFFSFIMSWIGSQFGVELSNYVTYSEKSQGHFHWEKFFVSYPLAIGALYITRRSEARDRAIVAAYAYMVACSALLLKYEVPFERLLSYSELLLPFVAVICVKAIGWRKWQLKMLWSGGVIAGMVLWTYPTIVASLGYSTV